MTLIVLPIGELDDPVGVGPSVLLVDVKADPGDYHQAQDDGHRGDDEIVDVALRLIDTGLGLRLFGDGVLGSAIITADLALRHARRERRATTPAREGAEAGIGRGKAHREATYRSIARPFAILADHHAPTILCKVRYSRPAMSPIVIALIAAFLGIAMGAFLAYFLLQGRVQSAYNAGRNEIAPMLARIEERAAQIPVLEERRSRDEATIANLNHRLADLQSRYESLATELQGERLRASEKIELLEKAREGLIHQFQALANQILEEKAKRFTEQNQQNLGQLLDPLRTQLNEFKGKVEEAYINEAKERVALREQVKHLVGMNQQLSKDANELAAALKGSSKTQGNWGELVLERILEMAGLRRGHEYEVQESHVREDGTRAQPDVVIHLPEERRIVIDSKVSLVAYQRAIGATEEGEREAAIREHLDSMRGHIRGLSAKRYEDLHGLSSLDFVVIFVPIEPAYMLALQTDPKLWQEAWERNVLLVSPSTLLFVLRTVAHLWRQEQQSRNAQDIANRGAALYDKLVGFVSDMEELDSRLSQARRAYDAARNKLSVGRGNVIRQAEMLKGLGVKPSKSLPKTLVEASEAARLPAELSPEPVD